ncbi:MAG: hypothetical protein K5905_24455 [Roseibium sp.]|uniref:BTAD domain-containing putative transcriptional regulator n=1 Tax=Roseibium sp. TaxID=1936156 RepID=UPI0026158757|nr:BTAD domain-containing putative transcriptional regulator [Roseibium sp.]MCV0428622.1 hypothetical protein [Roseibium sp.]
MSKIQEPVAVKTRKALAIMGYLSRMGGLNAPREALADLLWSSADRPKAMQSLRQALRQLKTAEQEAGFDVVQSSGGHVQLDQSVFSSDFMQLLALLERGRTDDFREAEELWRGDFLTGYEDIDPEFSDWLRVERERVRSEVTGAALRHLNQISIEDGGVRVEAGGRFLLKIDPALEAAHRVLIRLYMKLGQKERAEQQLKTCEREMKLHLDAEPNQETRDLLLGDSNGQQSKKFGSGEREDPTIEVRRNNEDAVSLPEVTILSSSLVKKGLNDAIHLREEVVSGLSSFRSFDLYQAEYFGEENAPKPTLIEGHELGTYLLRFTHDERTGKVVVQFEDRSNGRIIFNEIIDPSMWNSTASAGSQIVSRIHTYSTGRLRNPSNSSVFARWCQAEALLWDFTPQSDEKAMRILDELEQSSSYFSMTYAGKASIIMKQELHFPLSDKTISNGMSSLLDLAEKAIVLDPWQATNQRVYGWALILSNMPEDAKRAFRNASRLSTADPSNLMSVAEGLAFSGNVDEARATAEKAFSLLSFVPRVFYEYLANIFFAAEDYESAISQIERGAGVGVSGLTTRVAALICSGREEEAEQILQRYSEHRMSLLSSSPLGADDPEIWREKINFFQDKNAREKFDRGAAYVQRFLFNGPRSI